MASTPSVSLPTTRSLVAVSTMRPVVEGNLSLPILTNRLILRPLRDTDFEAYHSLLSQPEVVEIPGWIPDLRYTETELASSKPPFHDSQIFLGIFLKNSDGSEGELIGDGGTFLRLEGGCGSGWPEFFYRFKKEYWGKGYATEFATVFLQFWRSLPREAINLQVDPFTVDFQNSPGAAERLYASVYLYNEASERVLEKVGFELFERQGLDALTHWRKIL